MFIKYIFTTSTDQKKADRIERRALKQQIAETKQELLSAAYKITRTTYDKNSCSIACVTRYAIDYLNLDSVPKADTDEERIYCGRFFGCQNENCPYYKNKQEYDNIKNKLRSLILQKKTFWERKTREHNS